jgi:uncharacterized protein
MSDLREVINKMSENDRNDIRAWITITIASLIDNPEYLMISSHFDGSKVIVQIKVHQTDVGKIIGKKGRTARSIRTILSAISMKHKQKFEIDILENVK